MGFLVSFSGHDLLGLAWFIRSSVASIHAVPSGLHCAAAAASLCAHWKGPRVTCSSVTLTSCASCCAQGLRLWFYLCVPQAVTFLYELSP